MGLLGMYSTFQRESMLEVMVNGAGAGHDLASWEPVQDSDGRSNGVQCRCDLCGQTAWVGDNGVIYSLLDDMCPGVGAN